MTIIKVDDTLKKKKEKKEKKKERKSGLWAEENRNTQAWCDHQRLWDGTNLDDEVLQVLIVFQFLHLFISWFLSKGFDFEFYTICPYMISSLID